MPYGPVTISTEVHLPPPDPVPRIFSATSSILVGSTCIRTYAFIGTDWMAN